MAPLVGSHLDDREVLSLTEKHQGISPIQTSVHFGPSAQGLEVPIMNLSRSMVYTKFSNSDPWLICQRPVTKQTSEDKQLSNIRIER